MDLSKILQLLADVETAAYKPTKPYTGGLPKSTVKKGCVGVDVYHCQNFLNWCIGAGLTKDSKCGRKTDKKIRKYQSKYGLKVDGKFGPQCRRKAEQIIKAHAKPKPKPAPKPKPVETGASKIIARVKEYAWPYGTDPDKYSWKKGSARPTYKVGLKKYCGKSARVSQYDCGYFVNTVVRAAGLGSKFDALPDKASQPYPKLVGDLEIVHKGKKVPDNFLKAGDIIRYKKKTGGQHTMISMGGGKIAEAQRASVKAGKNAPAIKKDTEKYNAKNVKYGTIQVLRAR